MNFYRNEVSDPRTNAQRNLCGRTHYVDDDTLRWHKSRVLRARATSDGLLFWIITSDALDCNNTRRGFRYVVFDVFGNTLARPDLEHAFRTHAKCEKEMWEVMNAINTVEVTEKAIEQAERYHDEEMERMRQALAKIEQERTASAA